MSKHRRPRSKCLKPASPDFQPPEYKAVIGVVHDWLSPFLLLFSFGERRVPERDPQTMTWYCHVTGPVSGPAPDPIF
jgi:hypothetical protein